MMKYEEIVLVERSLKDNNIHNIPSAQVLFGKFSIKYIFFRQ